MIFSENQRYLTTRITYTIRNRIRHCLPQLPKERGYIYLYIFQKQKREKVTAVMAEP